MRFCVVGTNFISDRFCEAAPRVRGVEIAAVCSRKYETGRAFADKYGIKTVFSDYREVLLSPSVDAVYIATPTHTHYEYASAALRAGRAVLCEKMMCPTYDEVKELTALSESASGLLLEAMRPDFDPAYDAVRAAMSELGRVVEADLSFYQYSSRYDKFKSGEYTRTFDPRLKNSALADIGIYPLHMALSLFGESRSISAKSHFLTGGFEGAGEILLAYPEARARVHYSKIEDSSEPSVIVCERGKIYIDKISAPSRVTLESPTGEVTVLYSSEERNNMHHEISAFLKMARGEVSVAPYLRLAELTARVITEVYRLSGISDYF